MITKKANDYCSESPTKIEGYLDALNDSSCVWRIYHRNENTQLGHICGGLLRGLGLWFNRPANELKFVRGDEMAKIHNRGDKKLALNGKHTGPALHFLMYLRGKDAFPDITIEDVENMSKALSRLRTIHKQIKANCHSPCSCAYKYFGAKGIKMYEPWREDSDKFCEWALSNGYYYSERKRELRIERKEKSGDFIPDNLVVVRYTYDSTGRYVGEVL